MLILMVEDEHTLASLVIEYLEDQGIDCDYCDNGKVALERILNNQYDAVVLDLNLPGLEGIEICRRMREMGTTSPCIMLTARYQLEDKLEGFTVGADDYLVKPFALPELYARLKALVNRGHHNDVLQVHDLTIHVQAHQALRNGRMLSLSRDEFQLLLLLARHSPQVVSRERIENSIWPDSEPSDDAYKMLVYRLRKQLHCESEPLLHTIRGVGLALRLSQ